MLHQIEGLGELESWRDLSRAEMMSVVDQVISLFANDVIVFESLNEYESAPIACFRHVESDVLFNLLPGGRFDMGLSQHEEECFLALAKRSAEFDEFEAEVGEYLGISSMRPVHSQHVSPFLISKTPLTMDQCARSELTAQSLADNERREYLFSDMSNGDNVQFLHREELHGLCAKYGFKLPTEAQWEYAARGNKQTLFYFGDDFDHEHQIDFLSMTSFSDRIRCEQCANGFGLVGIGSTGELCADNWREDYSQPLAGDQPYIDGTDVFVRRGGAAENDWYSDMDWVFGMTALRSTTEGNPWGTVTARVILDDPVAN